MTQRHVVQVVRSSSFAGVERYITEVATELHRRGWQVTVIGGDVQRMRAELPLGVNHLPAVTVVDVARALWRVGRCDVVHAHMTAAELPAAALKNRLGARFVVTRHFATRRGRSMLGRVAGPVIMRRVDCQIAISRFVADAVGEPSILVYNGVRSSGQPAGPRSNTVVVMQRLEREKDTATAIRAWAMSGLPRYGWRLMIYGRGTEEDTLRLLCVELGAAGSIEFHEFHERPREILSRAGILLATAPAEPFGLTVVEAMAEGTPVIAAEGGAHRETLGEDGLYFAPGNFHDCARQLAGLAAASDERDARGERLRRRHQDQFTVTAHVATLARTYLADASNLETATPLGATRGWWRSSRLR